MKVIHVTFSNGEIWAIPCSEIADDRASDFHDRGTAEFDEMFQQTMADDAEILDWALNNMNWSELERFAVLTNEPDAVDYDEEWPNCKIVCADA